MWLLYCMQVGKFIQLVVTFFGGFIVAFAQGWLLTLVMMATIPPLVMAGAVMSNVVAKMASLGQAAYAESSVVVEQTIGSIRTVRTKGNNTHILCHAVEVPTKIPCWRCRLRLSLGRSGQ
jgi:ABC-type multidrug transport system fused ATPase/permease subunit